MLKYSRVSVSAIIAVALVFGAVTVVGVRPATAVAIASVPVTMTVDDITYTADSSAPGLGATVSDYSGLGGVVVIRASVTIASVAYSVTSVGVSAFEKKWLTSVTIPSSVKKIGVSAFQGNRLVAVSIPSSVTSIGAYAFHNNLLTAISIPSGITTINDSTFSRNFLTAITIPSSVTSIGESAFASNYLTSVTIPSSVTTVGANAFNNNKLTSVTIPSSVTGISDGTFQYNLLTSVVIPSSVTSIGDGAFSSNLLASLAIPTSVTTIGVHAFSDNVLTSVSIPSSVVSIGVWAFAANALTTVFMNGAAPALVNPYLSVSTDPFGDSAATIVYYTPDHAADFASSWQGYSTVMATGLAVFESRGHGDNPPLQLWPESAGTAVMPADPSAGQFTFLGWYTAPVGGVRWDPTTTVTNLVALYAHWGIAFDRSSIPTIIGAPQVGETLTAHAGNWSPVSTLSYVWQQDGSDIILGTGSTYVPTATDVAHSLTVTVTAIADGYQTQVLTSVASVAVATGTLLTTPKPLIYGAKQVAQVLSVDVGAWPEDAVLTYAWKWSGTTAAIGASSRYTPVVGDLGKKLTVTVTGTLDGYATVSMTSLPTTAILAGTFTLAPLPTISGTQQYGETLTAVTGTWTSGGLFTYVWKRSGVVIASSKNARYTTVLADIGKTLTVTVTATRSGFTALSKTSAVTAAVVAISFTTSPVPTVAGNSLSGSTLSVTVGDWSPSLGVTYSYVWKRASSVTGTKTAITGETGATYKLVTADKGKFITVTVTAVKTGYVNTSRTSIAKEIQP